MNRQGNSFDKFLDVSSLSLEGDFDEQVQRLLSTIRMTRDEVEQLAELVSDLTATLSQSWPGCKIYPFGSIVMGLGIRSSDIDCYVALPHWAQGKNTQQKNIVYRAKYLLSKEQYKYAEIFCIPQAKVPIVKFYHLPTDRNCDVNFKSLAGVQNSSLLAYLMHVDPRALPLAILVKYWSKVHVLTGTNLVPNYAMTLLVVFYLQHVSILPPVHLLQQSTPEHVVDMWNTAFTQIHFENNDNLSLYELLGGFFEFYANFDFKKQIVCPFLGCPIDRDCFGKHVHQMPEQYEVYMALLNQKLINPLKTDTAMCIQDPFEHCRNCSVAVTDRLFNRFISCIKNAADAFIKEHPNDFLKTALTKVVETKEEGQSNKVGGDRDKGRHHNKVEKRKEQNGLHRNINKNFHILFNQYRDSKRRRRYT